MYTKHETKHSLRSSEVLLQLLGLIYFLTANKKYILLTANKKYILWVLIFLHSLALRVQIYHTSVYLSSVFPNILAK